MSRAWRLHLPSGARFPRRADNNNDCTLTSSITENIIKYMNLGAVRRQYYPSLIRHHGDGKVTIADYRLWKDRRTVYA